MFDNDSSVSVANKPAAVLNANKNGWVTEDKGYLEVVWPNRFSNHLHASNCWLCSVERSNDVAIELEDIKDRSDRTIEAIPNVRGKKSCKLQMQHRLHCRPIRKIADSLMEPQKNERNFVFCILPIKIKIV